MLKGSGAGAARARPRSSSPPTGSRSSCAATSAGSRTATPRAPHAEARRADAGYTVFAPPPEEEEPVDNPPVVAETRVDIPTATVSDAVMLLDLRNTNALMFRNSGTGAFNMVYRRGDGTIGWVEPQREADALAARSPISLRTTGAAASRSGAPDERSFRHPVRSRRSTPIWSPPTRRRLFQQLAAAAAQARPACRPRTSSPASTRARRSARPASAAAPRSRTARSRACRTSSAISRGSPQPVDFQAIDGLPVDLVFLLLSPPDAGADHLKALATVSRVFRDRQTVAKLRGARSKDALVRPARRRGSARCRLRRAPAARPRISGRSNRSTAPRRSTACSNPRSRSPSRASRGSASRSTPATYHAAGAAHGTLYFKMMDDAAFYACNSMVSDRFLLTTAFNLVFTRPLQGRAGDRRGALGRAASAASSSARRG